MKTQYRHISATADSGTWLIVNVLILLIDNDRDSSYFVL